MRAGRSWLAISLCGLLSACGRSEPAGSGATAGERELRTVVYSQAFQTRLALSPEGVHELEPGLEAMALRLLQSPALGAQCFIDVYLKSSVDFDYPESATAGRLTDTSSHGLMFFLNRLTGPDYQFEAQRWHKQRWLFRSTGYSERDKRGIAEAGPIDAFDRELLPGLSVISVQITPGALDPEHGAARLWLLRAGQPASALNVNDPSTEHTIGFTVPDALLRHAAKATRYAASHPDKPVPGVGRPSPTWSIPPRAP